MGVEAARTALRRAPAAALGALWFATASPAYLDKTNATALHAALRLPGDVPALDFGGALRSGVGALLSALHSTTTTLVVMADQRDGLPGGADESAGGDAAAALVVGGDSPGAPIVARYLGGASATDEILDRWRAPGERRSKAWEERFGETRYLALGLDAWCARPQGGGHRGGRRGPPGGHGHAHPGRQGPGVEARRARRCGGRRPLRLGGPVGHGPSRAGADLGARDRRAATRPSPWCIWPTVPTPSSSAPPRPWRARLRPAPWRPRSTTALPSPTGSSCRGGAW